MTMPQQARQLPISKPSDPHEREADAIADRVATGGRAAETDGTPAPTGVRRSAAGAAPSSAGDPTPNGGGELLSASTLAWAEPALGTNLDQVRVHTGPSADRAAAGVSANAFTVGDQITFRAGRYDPDSGPGRRLLAHELAHVVQHRGGAQPGVRRQPAPKAEPDWAGFEAAFRDPNMVAHWNALDELATIRSPRAFDLILTRIEDKWDASRALEAALAYFIFYPDLAIGQLESVTGPGSSAKVTALNGLLASRARARGPAVDVAYQKLDTWMAAKDQREGGSLTRTLQRRQIRTVVERLRRTIARSYWITTNKLPGGATFVVQMDALLADLPALADKDVADLHARVLLADTAVTRAESRIDGLIRRSISLQVDQKVRYDSDEIKFIDDELVKPYDDALAKGRDLTALVQAVTVADNAYRDQASLYQARKIKQFREVWAKLQPPMNQWPLTNIGGLRAGAQALWAKWEGHRDGLAPRIDVFFKRHEAGEHLPVQEMAAIQRDLLTVQIEQAALSDYVSLFLLYEQLKRIEPKGLSSHVVMDFDDILANAMRFATTIRDGVLSDNLEPYIKVTDDVDFRIIFDIAKHRAEAIEDQQLALSIGLLAASFLAGFGVGLLVRGGGALAFGAEAIEAGTLGARALSAAEFAGNVAAFTVTSEALNTAAFGTKFDVGSLPGKMLENAIMFAAFGGLGRLTAGIGKGAATSFGMVAGFAARQGLNVVLFTGVGALGQRIFHGQFPTDWKRFMIQSVASYAMLSMLGAALKPIQQAVDAKTIDPLIAKRMATLEARQDALGPKLDKLTGGTGDVTLTKAEAEALRREIKELSGDYRTLLDFLKTSGKLQAAEADRLREALETGERALTDAVLSAERARIVSLDRLPELVPSGDGVTFTYPARRPGRAGTPPRGSSGLERALRAYDDAGYEVETNPESGEIAVYTPGRGELVARFIPDIGAIPDPAVEPGHAPKTAKGVSDLLRSHGFGEWEIVSLGDADAKSLRAHNARRVARLLEKFTIEDIRALARALYDSEQVLTERITKQLLDLVSAGKMKDFLDAQRKAAEEEGITDEADAAGAGLSILETNVRKPRSQQGPKQPPLWRLSEIHTGTALAKQFGPGWVASPRFPAPTAAKGETLGSTVPEFYRESTNTSVEVKRWVLVDMGIDPAHPGSRGTPSADSVDVLQRAARQVVARQWALPGKAPGEAPLETWLVLDVRGQGVTDLDATGASVKSLLAEYKVTYTQVMFLTETGLVPVK